MQALETGALGAVVPHVRNRRDCGDALAAMRYSIMISIIEDGEGVGVMEDIFSRPRVDQHRPRRSYPIVRPPGMGLRAEPMMAALEPAVALSPPRRITVMTAPLSPT